MLLLNWPSEFVAVQYVFQLRLTQCDRLAALPELVQLQIWLRQHGLSSWLWMHIARRGGTF